MMIAAFTFYKLGGLRFLTSCADSTIHVFASPARTCAHIFTVFTNTCKVKQEIKGNFSAPRDQRANEQGWMKIENAHSVFLFKQPLWKPWEVSHPLYFEINIQRDQ